MTPPCKNVLPWMAFLCVACASSPKINVGDSPDASVAGTGGVSGTSGIGGFGGSDNALTAAITEPPSEMAVEVITVSCAGECKSVLAVASGGNAPYAFVWSDGVTGDSREICATQDTSFTVTVDDTAITDGEFPYQGQQATASVTMQVLTCPEDGGVDAGLIDGVYWTTWTAMTLGAPGNASGVLSLPGLDIDVSYEGEVVTSSAITGHPSQLPIGVVSTFTPESTFTSATVPNPPPPSGMIYCDGSTIVTQTVRFSTPVRDPLVALLSLGSYFQFSTWTFNGTPQVLSSGPGINAMNGSLTASGQGVTGNEGNGVIELAGVFNEVTFTLNARDTTSFTIGVRGTP